MTKVKTETEAPARDPGLQHQGQRDSLPRRINIKVTLKVEYSKRVGDKWVKQETKTQEGSQFDSAILNIFKLHTLMGEGMRIDEATVTNYSEEVVKIISAGPFIEKEQEEEIGLRGSLDNFFGSRRPNARYVLEARYTEYTGDMWRRDQTGIQEHNDLEMAVLSALRIQHKMRVNNQWFYYMKVQRLDPTAGEAGIFAGFE